MTTTLEAQGPVDVSVRRRVVCSAVQYPYGIMLVGPRHFDAVMRDQYYRFFTLGTAPGAEAGVQGFLDQHGEFMTREEAHKVATEAGQIIRRCGGDDGRLFSENLY